MTMIDVRRTPRKRAMLGATIVFNNRCSTIECKIRNISEDGAKIVVGDTLAFPQRFEFIVPQHGRSYQARVIWRHEGEVGLEFLDGANGARHGFGSGAGAGADVDLAGRLRELESENAILRKRVIDLKAQLDRYFQAG